MLGFFLPALFLSDRAYLPSIMDNTLIISVLRAYLMLSSSLHASLAS